jgi:hypothetical protein
VLTRILGPEGDDVTGGWEEFHYEEFHNLCSSSNINRMIKSSNIRWTGYVAADKKNAAENVW